MENQNYWRKCASCGKEINFGGIYQACSVSSCRKFSYCSVDCWDLHLSIANHKSAWAEEERAPQKADAEARPRRRIVASSSGGEKQSFVAAKSGDIPKDVLIVASKLKNYVKAKHGLNTSGNVMDALSDIVRYHVDKAVDNARNEGRKTLMDRDF